MTQVVSRGCFLHKNFKIGDMETTANYRLFQEINGLTFWRRLFRWAAFRAISYEALQEFERLNSNFRDVSSDLESAKRDLESLSLKYSHAQHQVIAAETNLAKFEERVSHLQQHVSILERDKSELIQERQRLAQHEDARLKEHDQRMTQALSMKETYEKRLHELEESKRREAELQAESQRQTWREHEESAKNQLRAICDRLGVEYVHDVPVKGRPDMAIRICDEIIIFDAKSPASDDLSNFNTYLRNQAEAASKYLSDESIRKQIYLVVPSNTTGVIKKFSHNLGHYEVFVVTVDMLEPLILHLKKVEEYEFAEQLGPEDRQSICRIIGRFIHASKRRVQINQFLDGDLLELVGQAQLEIPESLQGEIIENERSRKLNPPADKRQKDIHIQELKKRQALLKGQSELHQVPSIREIGFVESVEG